jgi:hypothetical protein
MNYENPQFVAAIKKVLRSLANETNEKTEATQESTNPQVSKEGAAPVAHELHVSDSTIDRIKRQSTREQRHDRFKDRVETATLAIVLAYTIFAGYQWFELDTQNINQSAAIISAGATADRSLLYTRNQLEMAQQQFRLDQRAWVGVFEFSAINIPANSYAFIRAVIKNTGKTPALKTRSKIAFSTMRSGGRPDTRYKTRTYESVSVVQPGQEEALDVGTHAYIRKPLAGAISSGSAKAYVYGKILYVDIFGTCHRTTFCFYVKPGDLPNPCETYNDTDDKCE